MNEYRSMGRAVRVFTCLVVVAEISRPAPLFADVATAARGMVASVHPVATDAGLAALRAGGNAVDAAVATALTLGVVDGHNSGLGGGCFVLIRTAKGEMIAIDGRETAPAAATRDMYLRHGRAVPELSKTGPLAVGVPGALAAYRQAMTHGKLAFSDLLVRAAAIADDGFSVDRVYAGKLRSAQDTLALFSGSRDMLFRPTGTPYQEGDVLRLPDLAKTYRSIAEHGTDWFYRGWLADQVSAWMRANGGLLDKTDFADYRAKRRDPIVTTYRGYQIVGFPPPSSGGIHVAQILNILEHFEMPKLMREDPATAHHVLAEAMKWAFADRAYWLGDADFAKVPRGLVDKNYAAKLARRIKLSRVAPVDAHGLPPRWRSDVYGKHTTHIAAADSAGNWVGVTATINTTFGSKVVVPGTGVVLNNEMDDFSAQSGVPNAYGLVGAEANSIAPGKRPLSSMSPTIVLKDSQPVLTVGGAGGPKIITEVLLAIVRFIDGKQSLADCVGRPRIHHQWRPDSLFVERAFDADVVLQLRDRGHEIQWLSGAGVCQAISRAADHGTFTGVADPRVPGKAAGF